MNKSLKYSPNATKVGFADYTQGFSGKLSKSQQLDIICKAVDKTKFTPVFIDDKKFCSKTPIISATVTATTTPVTTTTTTATTPKTVQDLTIPPDKKNTDLLNAVLIGLGIVVVIKILS